MPSTHLTNRARTNVQRRARGPHGRLIAISFLACMLLFLTWQQTTTEWYQVAVNSGDAANDGAATSWIPVTLETISATPLLASPTGLRTAGSAIYGTPAAQVWTMLAGILTVLAASSRIGLFSIMGIGSLWMARFAATSLNGTLLGPTGNGRFVANSQNYQIYLDLLWLSAGMLLLQAIQITWAGSQRRRQAIRAGETPEPAVVDLYQAVAGGLNRYGRTTAPVADASGKPHATTTSSGR